MIAEHRLDEVPFALAPIVGINLGIGRLPHAVLIDPAGVIRSKGIVNSREHLESLLVAQETGYASMQDYLRGSAPGSAGAQAAAARRREEDLSMMLDAFDRMMESASRQIAQRSSQAERARQARHRADRRRAAADPAGRPLRPAEARPCQRVRQDRADQRSDRLQLLAALLLRRLPVRVLRRHLQPVPARLLRLADQLGRNLRQSGRQSGLPDRLPGLLRQGQLRPVRLPRHRGRDAELPAGAATTTSSGASARPRWSTTARARWSSARRDAPRARPPLGLWLAAALPAAAADYQPGAPLETFTGARADFAFRCKGCHGFAGEGTPGHVPRLDGFVGLYTQLAGRPRLPDAGAGRRPRQARRRRASRRC